ncbi:MAG TPA: GGDEF domain-containing protein, partial [Solirubrobacterales bacterium]|nr:GGDEF domain-containing protein [Solirubrobacterales bacterium]
MDRPPRPVRGEILRVRVIGLMMVTGGALAWLTVALPPAATGSDVVVLAIGAVAVVMGLALLATRREVPAAVLGAVVAFSTLLIAVASAEGGNGGTGTSDNEVLYVWVCLVSFYFLSLPHALTQLAIVGVAYAGVLSATEVALDDALTRWTVTVTTLLVAGLLIARLRRGLEHTVFELGQRARLDSLTGLLNRRGLEERAAVEFARVQRDGAPVGMIVADIDGFKAFNDARGHPAGDEVLNTVALALSTQTRELDAVARLGGDEFAVLLPGASLRKAKRVAERIRLAVARSARETGVGISLSVGVA